jgi:hypothetical protein
MTRALRVTPPEGGRSIGVPTSPILQAESRTVTFAKQSDGSLRVTCLSWPDAAVIRSEAIALHVTEIDTPPCLPLGRLSPTDCCRSEEILLVLLDRHIRGSIFTHGIRDLIPPHRPIVQHLDRRSGRRPLLDGLIR